MPPVPLRLIAIALLAGCSSSTNPPTPPSTPPAAPVVPGRLASAVVVSGLAAPLAFVQDSSDPTVQYVVEQGGRIRVVQSGRLLPADFLDLSAAITSGGERGLLGLAFPPDYASSGRFFVNFTDRNGDTVVARFARSHDRFVADPASRFDLLWSTGERVIRQPFANHNGGNLAFGPDGFLYIGMGDGGSADDPGNRAQDPQTLLGKMLRIDVVGVADGDEKGFRVPASNPFLDGQPVAALPEIWDFGLRNPWRFSFDDRVLGGTGALVIGDVGQNTYEEVDYEAPGAGGRNYGWRIREGAHPHVDTLPPAFLPLIDPIIEYDHTVGQAIVGGFVYRGRALGAAFAGRYFYGDLNGRVWSAALSIDRASGAATVVDRIEHTADLGGASSLGSIASFGVDANGEIYVVNLSGGTILRLVPG